MNPSPVQTPIPAINASWAFDMAAHALHAAPADVQASWADAMGVDDNSERIGMFLTAFYAEHSKAHGGRPAGNAALAAIGWPTAADAHRLGYARKGAEQAACALTLEELATLRECVVDARAGYATQAGLWDGRKRAEQHRQEVIAAGNLLAKLDAMLATGLAVFGGMRGQGVSKLAQLQADGYVVNGVAIFHPETSRRGLVDYLGYVGWVNQGNGAAAPAAARVVCGPCRDTGVTQSGGRSEFCTCPLGRTYAGDAGVQQ